MVRIELTEEQVREAFKKAQSDEVKAKYFGGRNFINLWAEYLRFNFGTGDYLIQEE